MKISREVLRGSNHTPASPFRALPKRTARPVKLSDRRPGGTLLTAAKAHELVKGRNLPLLEAGTLLTVCPGTTLQKVRVGVSARYQLITEG